MTTDKITFGFPFAVGAGGGIVATGGDEAIRGKIIQVLFTAQGERVHKPAFGCGLFNMVFEPSDAVTGEFRRRFNPDLPAGRTRQADPADVRRIREWIQPTLEWLGYD